MCTRVAWRLRTASGREGNHRCSFGVAEPLRFTFRKTDRILKRHEFIALSEHGRKFQNDAFIALVLPGRTDRTRLGITVTRKVGRAVTRNRVKRLVREFFRQRQHRLQRSWDVNIIAKRRAAELPSDLVFAALKSLFDHMARQLEGDRH